MSKAVKASTDLSSLRPNLVRLIAREQLVGMSRTCPEAKASAKLQIQDRSVH